MYMEEEKKYVRCFGGKLKGGDRLENISVYGKITLKLILGI
jgi:hypothetical protein